MYANEELVKLIQENAPEVEVDDSLSNTSENPVQNKVIYGALEEKQDLLPTSVANKYLKTDANGDLEWGDASVSLYKHHITFKTNRSMSIAGVTHYYTLQGNFTIETSSPTAYTATTFYNDRNNVLPFSNSNGLLASGIIVEYTDDTRATVVDTYPIAFIGIFGGYIQLGGYDKDFNVITTNNASAGSMANFSDLVS